MKQIYLIAIFCCLNIAAHAQFPIAYWSFEDATHASQSLAVTDQITGANGAAALNVTSAGAVTTTSVAGAGALHGGAAGLGMTSGNAFTVANPGTGATSYWEFSFTNTATSGLMTMTFDAMASVAGLHYEVLVSSTGGAPFTALTTFGGSALLATIWTTYTVTQIPAGTNVVRIYGYNSTASAMSIDNVNIMASTTAVTGSTSFTTADAADIYSMMVSGASTGEFSSNTFTVGNGCNVTINNTSATSGVLISLGGAFNVLTGGTATFGNTGIISGPGGYSMSAGSVLITAHPQGITVSTLTATGSVQTTSYRTFVQSANYVYNGSVAQVTGTGLPTTILSGGSVTIDNSGPGVTLTEPILTPTTTFNSGASLNLENGLFINTAANLIMGAGSDVNVDNGTLSVVPTTYNGVNLTYMNLGFNNLAYTTGNEWPPAFSGNTTVNKPGAIISLNGNKVNNGPITLTAGTLDATTSNYNISLTGTWTNNSGTAAFNARAATVTANGGTPQTFTGTFATTFNNLIVNDNSYLTLGVTENVFGTLTLTHGIVVIGTNNLVLGTTTPPVIGAPSFTNVNMICATSTGQVEKLMNTNGSFVYPVGDTAIAAPAYTPITLNFTSGTYGAGAYAGVNLRYVKHPNNANVTNYLNRYWSVALSGITAPSYSVSATYIPYDVVGTEASIDMGQYTGALPWIRFGATNTATHTLSSGFVSNITSDFTGINGGSPVAASTANTTICSGTSVSLSASGSTGDPTLTYSWAPATGLSATTGTPVTATPTVTTTYTLTVTDGNGLTATATTLVSVTAVPSAITGTTSVCVGLSTTLNSIPAGGIWTSSNTANATANPALGIVTGVAAGTTNITYGFSPTCYITTPVTVNPNPTTITGTPTVCLGLTTTLNSTPAGGIWSSSNGNATVGSSTGVVTGSAVGTSTLTYTIGTGCYVTTTVTVNDNPAAITGNVAVCVGFTTTLNSTPAGGIWSSSNGNATIGSGSGILTGSNAGASIITYSLSTGCINTTIATVNPNPGISGPTAVCLGLTITLTPSIAGGTWSSSNGNATVGSSSGIVTGAIVGTSVITYTLPTGCIGTYTVTVNDNPVSITGTLSVCAGLTTTLNSTPAGGTWSSSNGNVSISPTTGIVTGLIAGTSIVSYALSTGCVATAIVTINASPGTIIGSNSVCVGLITALTDAGGGTWVSSSANATVDGSGNVTGVSIGTSTISYTLSDGCMTTTIITVNPNPTPITGTNVVCVGLSTTLNSTPAGGVWTSSNSNAIVGSSTGIVTGSTAGSATITYAFGNGCYVTMPVTVNANPTTITGTLGVCLGLTTTLNSTPAGGTWSSSSGHATIGSGTGVVTGAAVGTSVITYALNTGCINIAVVTVNPNPTNITGSAAVCVGTTTTLNSTPAGGAWTSSSGNATVGALTGIVTGVTAGTAIITYTLSTGCINTITVTINPNPTNISGTAAVCVGLTTTLNSTPAGGTWTSSNGNSIIGSSTGVVTGVTAGTSVITYTINTGCYTAIPVTINPNPTNITGNTAVCVGLTTTLNSTPAGGTWSSSNGNVTIGSLTGIATGINIGTATITYTLGTGCINTITVSVNTNPTSITGGTSVCVGATTTLNSTPAGGTWSSSNGNATIGLLTGIVTGVLSGTSTITYSLGTGCTTTTVVTVNTTPTSITGNLNVCVGLTTTLNSTPAGGTWSSSNGNATIDPVTGIVTGAIQGTSVITYLLSTGCQVTTTVTVDANPTAITGNLNVCVGLTTTLNSTPAGGTWSSSNGNITIGSATGIATGVISGTSVITYTIGTGCITTAIVTVNPNPGSINGNFSICVGSVTTLNSTPAGGGWSSSSANAIIDPVTGVVIGAAAGTSIITYTLGTGCISTVVMTVNANPTTIMGNMTVCAGLTTTLNSTPAGGTWSSSNINATVGISSGVVTGLNAGTSIITYATGTSCIITTIVTVDPLPSPIIGTLTVCAGLTTALTDVGGGTWSSSNANAVVGSSSGVVTGSITGTSIITYTLSTGCIATAIVTVYPLPSTIMGNLSVCAGLTTSLSDFSGGGTWTSSAPAIASVGLTTGIVTGGPVVATSTAIITYIIGTGCTTSTVVTVYPLPAAITGVMTVCVNAITDLTDASPGGTWSSSATGIATVGLSTGVVTGVAAGTATIVYALPTGCITTAIVTVDPLPGPILGTLVVCSGLTTTLSDNTGGGTWSSSVPAVATIDPTGIVTGGAVLTASTTTITYTIGTGCTITATVTVNPLPGTILGSTSVCVGLTTPLLDFTAGGTWSSSASGIASVDPTGVVTGVAAGTATISYILSSTGCYITTTITVNPLPTPILGTLIVCSGATTLLSDAVGGGTWSSGSGLVSVGSTTGIVTGGAVGSVSTAIITYTLPTTCITTAIVTIDPLPAPISGTFEFCAGVTTTLTDATPGGTWTSSDIYIATIGYNTGVIFGSSGGTVTITYTISTGCVTTAVVTVDPLPGAILGNLAVCQGLTTSLSDLTPAGTWSIAPPGFATISATGLVTATAAGTTIVTYTLVTGCSSNAVVTVNPLPSNITGTRTVCSTFTTTLSDITAGGAWSSSNPPVANVGSATGVVTGGAAGTATITYELPTGCIAIATVSVNPLPVPIAGSLSVCVGLTTSLTDAGGGTWSMSNGNATIGSTGIVTGSLPGLDNVIYTLPTGCMATATVTVYALPVAISGTLSVCAGLTTTLSDSPTGGIWSSSNTAIATIGSTTGIVTGAALLTSGTATITYNLATGCIETAVVTVNPLPTTISGSRVICIGHTTTLNSTPAGGTWSTSNTLIGSAGPTTGVITGVNPGTVTITYTLPTGCIVTTVVTVTPLPGSILGTSVICSAATTDLSDLSPGGTWSSGNPGIGSVNSTGVVTGTGSGTVTISYTLSAGCIVTDVVTVNPLPSTYSVTGGGAYCEGGAGRHIGLSGSNVGISYLLYYGPSVTGYLAGTGSALDFGLLTVGGVYTVVATNNTTGCSINMLGNATITITPTMNPTVGIIPNMGDTVCSGTSVTFTPHPDTASATSATYKWSVNGVLVSVGTTYTFIPADGDVVTVVMTSNGVCVYPHTATDTLVMHVIPDGTPTATISIDPGDSVCEYAAATFTVTSTFGGPHPVYTWYVNGLASGTGTVFTYVPTTGDNVYCRMTSDYRCRLATTVNSNVAVMTVIPLLIPHVDVVSTMGFDIVEGTYDTLRTIVTNAGPNPTYQWEINGLLIPGATADTFVSQFNNYDSVTCVVTSTGFCEGISTFDWVYITVHPLGVQQYTTGAGDIRLMPNPNTGVFAIRGTLGTLIDEEISVEVTDMMGQIVYRSKIMTQGGKINEQIRLNNVLANGTYILNLRSGSESKAFHFVIEQ